MHEYKLWYNHSVLVAVRHTGRPPSQSDYTRCCINTLNVQLNSICHLLSLLGVHHIIHVSRLRVKSLTLRFLMSHTHIYIYVYIYIYIWSTYS